MMRNIMASVLCIHSPTDPAIIAMSPTFVSLLAFSPSRLLGLLGNRVWMADHVVVFSISVHVAQSVGD